MNNERKSHYEEQLQKQTEMHAQHVGAQETRPSGGAPSSSEAVDPCHPVDDINPALP